MVSLLVSALVGTESVAARKAQAVAGPKQEAQLVRDELGNGSEQLPVTTWHLSCYKPLVASPVRPDAIFRILSGSSGNPVRAER